MGTAASFDSRPEVCGCMHLHISTYRSTSFQTASAVNKRITRYTYIIQRQRAHSELHLRSRGGVRLPTAAILLQSVPVHIRWQWRVVLLHFQSLSAFAELFAHLFPHETPASPPTGSQASRTEVWGGVTDLTIAISVLSFGWFGLLQRRRFARKEKGQKRKGLQLCYAKRATDTISFFSFTTGGDIRFRMRCVAGQ